MPRRFLPALIAFALGTLSLASKAAAQGGLLGGGAAQRPIRVVVSGGLTLPSGDLKELHDTGFHYDASMIFSLAGLPIALRPEISLTTLKSKEGAVPAAGSTLVSSDDFRTRLLAAVGNIEIPLAGGLYAIAGVGALNSKTTLDESVAGGQAVETAGQTALTFGAGAGFRFHISRIDGFIEGRFGSASYERGKVGYKQAQLIPLTFGLVF